MANVSNMIKASSLRVSYGCYQWWATKDETLKILEKLGLGANNLGSLECVSFDGKDLYCIYVGSAPQESVMGRLNWHINRKNGKTHISTLRRTVAALYGYNLYDDESISKKICEFYVSWAEFDQDDVLKMEVKMINAYFRPLNIRDNDKDLAKQTIPVLKKLRGETRTHVKEN